jgi:hypothetical protein
MPISSIKAPRVPLPSSRDTTLISLLSLKLEPESAAPDACTHPTTIDAKRTAPANTVIFLFI